MVRSIFQNENEREIKSNQERREEEDDEINKRRHDREIDLELEAKDANPYSISSRFGERITEEKKWGIFPYLLFEHQGDLDLSIGEIWFLTWVLAHKWDERHPYPSLRAMSRYTGKWYHTVRYEMEGAGCDVAMDENCNCGCSVDVAHIHCL